ncbi:MAG: hypothetical protein U1F24_01385 [Alphaproteobacteria bacterium]|jgi:predicted tellurium resistance membrane protein TerC
MRALAHIAAFAIIVLVGYLLMTRGYHSFLIQMRSPFLAQIMTFICLGFTTMVTIWATRKIP